MEVTIAIAVLVIICLALTLALIHKDKKSDEEQQVSVYNSMLLCILCKFVVMLNERIPQETIIGCMTNAVKVCANNDMFIITGEYPDGTKDVLAQSKTLEIPSSYWLDHSDEMKLNDSLFKAYISLITTKTGDVIGNSVVKDILIEYAKGGKA